MIVLYADVLDYNVDDFISPFMSLESLNDEERKWSTCDGESTCLWQHLRWSFRLRTFIETSLPCWDGPTPRQHWRPRASWRGQTRTSTTTWRRIHCYGRFDFLLGVAWSEINLILCDAVGNDRRDDGDVRDIDDDVEKRGRVDNPIPSPLRIITVEIDSITWAGWFSKRIWPHIFFGFSLPGAAGVECSMAREMGNTVIFSISPDLIRISVSP